MVVGEGVEVRRSPQAVACRNRYAEELGRPHEFLVVGRAVVGHADIVARKGKPGNGAMRAGLEAVTGRQRSTVRFADASATEEPDAGILHVRACARGCP
jgi:hypothetical protein